MKAPSKRATRPAASDASWLDPAERAAWVSLAIVLQILPAELDAQLQRDAGLTFFEYSVLARLSELPGRTARMSELATLARGSLSRLSHAATKLERRGLLRREPCPGDGRYTNAVLTDQGWDAISAAAPTHVAHVRELVIDAMSASELAHLRTAADRILATMDLPAVPIPV